MMLVLARHVECVANTERRHVGRSESPVTARGERQAGRLASALASDPELSVVRVVSSPLGRALRTAEAIAAALGQRSGARYEVGVDERLVELDYGELDGTCIDDPVTPLGEAWRHDPTRRVAGGESLAEAAARVAAACAELTGGAAGTGDVVVVSHVLPIKLAVCWALGLDPGTVWQMDLAVASLTRLSSSGATPHLAGFNEHGYLGEDASPPFWR